MYHLVKSKERDKINFNNTNMCNLTHYIQNISISTTYLKSHWHFGLKLCFSSFELHFKCPIHVVSGYNIEEHRLSSLASQSHPELRFRLWTISFFFIVFIIYLREKGESECVCERVTGNSSALTRVPQCPSQSTRD